MTTKQAILEMSGVTRDVLQNGKKLRILQKTEFKARAGELIAVIGPSGSGKSTFLTIAGGLQNPSSGSVLINQTDITNLSAKQLSNVRLHEVGFILQASNLVPYLTVEKQLLLFDKVMRRSVDIKMMKLLFNELDINSLRNKYPSDLSGGERQRVAIAKVLYGNSSLILADEPTASLDSKRAFEVVDLLARETRQRDKATIMVTHDERLIDYCDSVYEMHDGVLKKRSGHKKIR